MISGKLLNYSSELGTNLSDVDMVKKLISGEPIDARNPYGRPFTVRKYCKFMFNTNSLPTSVEISDAYFRRMNFMQFDVTIPKSEQDPELAKKIIEREPDGVLQWVLDGLRRLLATRKFTKSPKMEAAKEQIRRDLDSVATFMSESGYIPSTSNRILLKNLREEYNEFCKLNNCRQVGHKSFGFRLRAGGFDVVSGTGNRTYVCCETTQPTDLARMAAVLEPPKATKQRFLDLLERIEAQRIDITASYCEWFTIGCVIATLFGDDGFPLFHRISCFYPNYDYDECERLFSDILKRGYRSSFDKIVSIAERYGLR